MVTCNKDYNEIEDSIYSLFESYKKAGEARLKYLLFANFTLKSYTYFPANKLL